MSLEMSVSLLSRMAQGTSHKRAFVQKSRSEKAKATRNDYFVTKSDEVYNLNALFTHGI